MVMFNSYVKLPEGSIKIKFQDVNPKTGMLQGFEHTHQSQDFNFRLHQGT